jgi:hypothetical protein
LSTRTTITSAISPACSGTASCARRSGRRPALGSQPGVRCSRSSANRHTCFPRRGLRGVHRLHRRGAQTLTGPREERPVSAFGARRAVRKPATAARAISGVVPRDEHFADGSSAHRCYPAASRPNTPSPNIFSYARAREASMRGRESSSAFPAAFSPGSPCNDETVRAGRER